MSPFYDSTGDSAMLIRQIMDLSNMFADI